MIRYRPCEGHTGVEIKVVKSERRVRTVPYAKFEKVVQPACIFEAGERVYSTATKKDPDVKAF